jgi:hypothetical protein
MPIKPYYFSLLGLIIDIIGVFFLSVEAIKLDNFKKIRDRFFIPFNHSVSYNSPKFQAIFAKEFLEQLSNDSPGSFTVKKEEANAFLEVFYNFYFTHYVGGFIGFLFLVYTTHFLIFDINKFIKVEFGYSVNFVHHIIVLVVLVIISLVNWILTNHYAYRYAATYIPIHAFAIITILTPPSLLYMIIGELIHMLFVLTDKIVLSTLNLIDRKTVDGTIGIVGFVLVTVGFILQFYGTWKGGT